MLLQINRKSHQRLYYLVKEHHLYRGSWNVALHNRATRRVSLVEQELAAFQEHLVFSGVHVSQSLVLWVVLC